MATVYDAFVEAARVAPDAPFLCVPQAGTGNWRETTYADAAHAIEARREAYGRAGYGHGHAVAMLLDKTEFVFHVLALNALGCIVVPLNPDLRPAELRYQIGHADCDAVVVEPSRLADFTEIVRDTPADGRLASLNALARLPGPARPIPQSEDPASDSICSVLYTSGTTGLPKGCLLSNDCHLIAGQWYADMGGRLTMRMQGERFFNPTPFHHTNILVVNLTCVLLTRNCLIMPDRFSASRWWRDVVDTRATAIHYVGIIPTILMKQPPGPLDRAHVLAFGFGGGAEPGLHAAFEARFGFPLVEIWGMTETTRVFGDHIEPRAVGTRAIGRPSFEYQAIVVGDDDQELARGTPGELLVRSGGDNPRLGFFSGYHKDPKATAEAWRNGWFHTGDIAFQDAGGMLHFVDRKKNIIRRAGENISAAEVEAALIAHPYVDQVAVIAVPDDVREEEVMACVVPSRDAPRTPAAAEAIVRFCLDRLAYYKAPAYLAFRKELPMTASHRLQRAMIFPKGVDPRAEPDTFDLRQLKVRPVAPSSDGERA
jgi:crotonobetaine/carnitine-CoA ligase